MTLKQRDKYLEGLSATQTWFYISDIHYPFHNKVLLEKVLSAIYYVKPYGIILGGDQLDMFSLSSYAQDSAWAIKFGLSLAEEYDLGNELMDAIDGVTTSDTKKIWISGNHEARHINYLKKGDNAKLIGSLPAPTEALRLRERGYSEIVEDWMNGGYMITPELEAIHGIFVNVHTAKNHLDKLGHSVVFGHCHRMQSHYTAKHVAVTSGGLFDKSNEAFSYMPRAQRNLWANGFTMIDVNDNGNYYINSIMCPKNSFVLDGKLF